MKQIGVYQKKSRAYEATGCIVEEQILERFGSFPLPDKPEGYYCLSVKEPMVLYVTVEKTVSMEDLRGSRKYVVYLPDDLPEADPETAAAILNAYCKQTGTVRAHPAEAAAALVLLDSLPPEIRRSLILTGHAVPGAICADPDAPPAEADPVCTAFLREPKIFARLPQEFASEVQFRTLTPGLFRHTLDRLYEDARKPVTPAKLPADWHRNPLLVNAMLLGYSKVPIPLSVSADVLWASTSPQQIAAFGQQTLSDPALAFALPITRGRYAALDSAFRALAVDQDAPEGRLALGFMLAFLPRRDARILAGQCHMSRGACYSACTAYYLTCLSVRERFRFAQTLAEKSGIRDQGELYRMIWTGRLDRIRSIFLQKPIIIRFRLRR